MWRTIIWHEWRRLLREKTAWVIGLGLPALVIFGALNGLRWTTFQRTALDDIQKAANERLTAYRERVVTLEQKNAPVRGDFDARLPLVAGSFFFFQPAVLPPPPLATFAIGDSDLRPYAFRMTAQEAVAHREIENPLNAATGWFDVAFVVTFLLPLLVFALGYDAISGEREHGTLALVLAQPVSLSTLLGAKLVVQGTLLVGVVWLSGWLALALTEGFSSTTILRFVLWMLVVGVYGLLWVAVLALVVAQGWSSATNAISLVVIWLIWGILTPSAIVGVSDWRSNGPTAIALVNARRTAEHDFEANEQSLTRDYLSKQAVSTVLKPDDFSVRLLAMRVHEEAAVGSLREAHE